MAMALFDPSSAFATSLLLLAGFFTAGLAINAFAAKHREMRGDHIALTLVCASSAAYLVCEVAIYRSHDPAQHALLRRWEHLVAAPFSIGYPIFLAQLAGISTRVVAGLACAITGTAVTVAMCSQAGLWLTRIDSLREFRLPWGEVLMFAQGPESAWKWYSLANWLLISSFGVWSALRLRRDRAAIGVWGLVAGNCFFLVALVHDSLLDAGVIRGVFLSELVIPVLASAMWWRVGVAHRRRVQAWRRLFASAGDAILVQDLEDGRVVEANDAACAMLGRARSELVGIGLDVALAGPAGSPAVPLASLPGPLIERECRRGDGAAFPAEIDLRRAEHDGRPCVVASVRDLSARRRAERHLVENEHRLRQVIELSPIAVAECDLSGRAIALNPSFERAFGYRREELDSLAAWARLAEPDTAERGAALMRWEEALRAALHSDGVVPSFRAEMRGRHGETRRVDIATVAAGDRLLTFITDLTDILDARDSLAEQEALQRAVIEESADGVTVGTLRDGRPPAIELWNRRMAEIAGVTLEDARARGLEAALGPGGRAILREPVRDLEVTLARDDGTRRECLISSSAASGAPGERRLVTFVRDITDQRRVEEERRALDTQAQGTQQFEALGVLAGGIAHDFNNLLMTILGRTGLVRAQGGIDQTMRIDLDEMEAAAARAAALCRQLLVYAGRGAAKVDVVDLASVARAMEPLLAATRPKRGAIAPVYSEGALIAGDVGQLRQVILNLVTNAAEAIGDKPGTVTVRIARVAEPTGDVALLQVSDDGVGMDAETRARMFDPFFTTRFTGRGLGLSVVLGIVRAHRGTVSVESAPGMGTSISVRFPALELAAPPSGPSSTVPKRRGSALVVDDEPSLRAVTAEMLGCLGFEVSQASSAREALDVFAKSGAGAVPRLVILDLTLPDAAGEHVLDRLRRAHPATRVIVASGYAREEVRRFLGDAQADGILTKPYGIETLANAVDAACGLGAP
jgi:PAS domain S-box-containing protein